MDFQEIIKKAKELQFQYEKLNKEKGNKKWGAAEYLQGWIGDVGELSQQLMSKNNFRSDMWSKEQIEHELADCLWSVLTIANDLNINLEKAFLETMNKLEKRIKTDKR